MAPASSPSPSKKLLITDPKSKSNPDPFPAPSYSAATSTASPDQPNLSDCHCCGYRIDHTNPKDRLQLLDSIWRIVLVCRDCRKAIRFGRKCPFCFKGTANSSNLFQCGSCRRKIHQGCVEDCGNWFNFVDEGSRVCVDCWVPEYLKKSFRVCDGSDDSSEGGSKDKTKVGKHKPEKVGNVKGRPLAATRLCRNGVDLNNVVLALPVMGFKFAGRGMAENLNHDPGRVGGEKPNAGLAEDGVTGEKLNLGDNGSMAGDLDDGELDDELHSRGDSSKCRDVSSIKDWNGLTYKRYGLGKIFRKARVRTSSWSDVKGLNSGGVLPYKRDKMRKMWQLIDNGNVRESVPGQETEIGLSGDQNSVGAKFDRFGKEFVGYNRSRFKKCKLSRGNNNVVACKAEEVSASRRCDDERECDHGKVEEGNVLNGSGNREPDPFRYKYARRMKGAGASDVLPVTFLSKIEALSQG